MARPPSARDFGFIEILEIIKTPIGAANEEADRDSDTPTPIVAGWFFSGSIWNLGLRRGRLLQNLGLSVPLVVNSNLPEDAGMQNAAITVQAERK